MRIHEYQAKRLLKNQGIPVPRGAVAFSAVEAEAAARFLGGARWAVKAQIHAGGRGRAGGVRFAEDLPAVKSAADALLGKRLVTAQTPPAGLMVKRLYVEEALSPLRELYVAVYVDRSRSEVALLGSPQGGLSIEEGATRKPEGIVKFPIDAHTGLTREDARQFASRIVNDADAIAPIAEIALQLYSTFAEFDASLVEINPLGVQPNGKAIALDARVILDDNALFRHPDLMALRDDDEASPDELEAARHEINYVAMSGNVGCVANGAGLGMASVDLLKHWGVEPANFMDIRPVATREQIATGFRMMLKNRNLKCIFVNIFGGGIIRCDLVAEGMVLAAREVPIRAPVVVRFAGTNAELGRKLLANSALSVEFASGLSDAAGRVSRILGARTGGGSPSRAVARWA